MKISRLLFVAIFFGVVLINGAACSSSKGLSSAPSIAQLTIHPERYLGVRVVLRGYLVEHGGLLLLYPTKEDSMMENVSAAVKIVDNTQGRQLAEKGYCIDNFAFVIGEFSVLSMLNQPGISRIEMVQVYDFNSGTKTARMKDCLPDIHEN